MEEDSYLDRSNNSIFLSPVFQVKTGLFYFNTPYYEHKYSKEGKHPKNQPMEANAPFSSHSVHTRHWYLF